MMLTQTEIRKSKYRKRGHQYYKTYPYRKREWEGTNAKNRNMWAYVPTKEHTEHKFSLTYEEWREIIQEYYTGVCELVANAKKYYFYHRMGTLHIEKYRYRNMNKTDYNKAYKRLMKKHNISLSEAKKIAKSDDFLNCALTNKNTDNWRWKFIWSRQIPRFSIGERYWTVLVCRPRWLKMNRILEEKIHFIKNN